MAHDRPAAEGVGSGHFPGPPVDTGHVEPCPRRVRARVGGTWVLDTTAAFYVWEHPYYPEYAVPADDLPEDVRRRGRPAPDAASRAGLPDGHVVLRFGAAEEWFEEDEPVLGHPRSPFVRVDALRTGREVLVTHDGRVLAHAHGAVAVFETGLPPRWYVDRPTVDWSLLSPTSTETRCPYKGLAADWWAAGETADVAWSYAAPTAALAAITGLVAFDDTLVSIRVTPA